MMKQKSWLILGALNIETSAKTNFNCKEAFEKLAQKIVAEKSSGDGKKCGCNIF